jgi:hypothetical protein
VVADTDQIDSWVRNTALWRAAYGTDILTSVERARKLRAEVQLARENLHLKMDVLRKEMAVLRAKRRQR